MKGEHTSGWVKVPVRTEDKLYIDYPITKLKNVGLKRHANCMSLMLDWLRIYVIMKTKTISKSNWKPHLLHSRQCLIMSRQQNYQTDQNKLITKKLWIPMNPNMVLIGALKWRIHPCLDSTAVWTTWLNIWWVKRKGCLKVQLTNILVFLIIMPCHWWQKRKLLIGW